MNMDEKKLHPEPEQLLDLRVDPEQRLCPAFDNVCIGKFRVAS